ncbi:uncharacterized protein LOC144099376 isoform X2 [Amblyomma americanum]
MLSDPWRLQPAVPDLIGDGGSTDDEDDYEDDGFADPYEVAGKLREANARLRADSTPLESSRERRVRFRDPIRAVFCFTPDGEGEEEEEEEEGSSKGEEGPPSGDDEDDQEEDASIAHDAASRYGTVRRLVTAAAVERRGSLSNEEPPPPSTVGGLGGRDSSEKLLGLGADSDEDIDSFESDNTSVSEDISDLSDDKDDNQNASVQEVSDASVEEGADGDRLDSPPGVDGGGAAESSFSPEGHEEARPRLSWDNSVEEVASISVQEEAPSGIPAESVQSRGEEDAVIVCVSPDSGPLREPGPPSAPSGESSRSQDDGTHGGPLQTATVAPQSRTSGIRPPTSQTTLVSIYSGAPRPRSVGVGGRVMPPRAGRGRSGFVASEAAQRVRRPWSGPAQGSAGPPSTSRVSSARPATKTPEQELRGHAKQQQKRQQASPRDAREEDTRAETKAPPYAVAVGSASTSTYALPRELKEELVRKKRRERELREKREAREERERRQRAQEAERAFKAWLAKKRRQGSLPRSDRSVSRGRIVFEERVVAHYGRRWAARSVVVGRVRGLAASQAAAATRGGAAVQAAPAGPGGHREAPPVQARGAAGVPQVVGTEVRRGAPASLSSVGRAPRWPRGGAVGAFSANPGALLVQRRVCPLSGAGGLVTLSGAICFRPPALDSAKHQSLLNLGRNKEGVHLASPRRYVYRGKCLSTHVWTYVRACVELVAGLRCSTKGISFKN